MEVASATGRRPAPGRMPRLLASVLLASLALAALPAEGKVTETATLHLVAHVPEKTEVEVGRDGRARIETTGDAEDYRLEQWTDVYDGREYKVVCVSCV